MYILRFNSFVNILFRKCGKKVYSRGVLERVGRVTVNTTFCFCRLMKTTIPFKKYLMTPSTFLFSDIEMTLPTKVIPRLSQLATDSDVEPGVELTDTDSEDSAEYYMGRRGSSSRTGGWRS